MPGDVVIVGQSSPLPIGTLQEIQAQGLDPREWASCAAHVPGSIRGCALYEECEFNLRKNGAFKGVSGPHIIGYRLVTDRVEGNNGKEDTCTFMTYVEALQARARAGRFLRDQGQDGERIHVVAQEGEEVLRHEWVQSKWDARGECIAWEQKRYKMKVPKFLRPGEMPPSMSYSREIVEREKARIAREDDIEAEVYAEQRKQALAEAATETVDLDMTVPKGKK